MQVGNLFSDLEVPSELSARSPVRRLPLRFASSQYRRPPQLAMNFDEIVVDNFAGGGGASTGIELALGRPVDVAINHDAVAVAMHMANHPGTRHYCESVWEVDPRDVAHGQPVGLVWLSPDCRHHSKARGGKPVSKRVRGLAWVALRWMATVRPRVVMLENVEEFQHWGPLTQNERGEEVPCRKRKGNTFRSFINAIRRQGYAVEWRELRACGYGTPTIRKRLFLIARCDGQPIVWPEYTHGPGLKPYRTAAEIIDWSIPCPSIFERKKPLADKTLRRIAEGLRRFVMEAERPFTVPTTGISAFLTEHANGSNQRTWGPAEPLRTQVAQIKGAHFALVQAFLAKHYGGVVGHGPDRPLGTVTTVDHHAVVTSHLVTLRNNCIGRDHASPLPTITAGATHLGGVRAFLVKYYGEGGQWQDVREPLHTVPTKARMGLVTVHGEDYQIVDIGMRMLTPRELYRAQGFPDDYIIDRDAAGRPITKEQQIHKCGNSVPPPFAKALVEANYQPANASTQSPRRKQWA